MQGTSWLLPKVYCAGLSGAAMRERQVYDLAVFALSAVLMRTLPDSLGVAFLSTLGSFLLSHPSGAHDRR